MDARGSGVLPFPAGHKQVRDQSQKLLVFCLLSTAVQATCARSCWPWAQTLLQENNCSRWKTLQMWRVGGEGQKKHTQKKHWTPCRCSLRQTAAGSCLSWGQQGSHTHTLYAHTHTRARPNHCLLSCFDNRPIFAPKRINEVKNNLCNSSAFWHRSARRHELLRHSNLPQNLQI